MGSALARLPPAAATLARERWRDAFRAAFAAGDPHPFLACLVEVAGTGVDLDLRAWAACLAPFAEAATDEILTARPPDAATLLGALRTFEEDVLVTLARPVRLIADLDDEDLSTRLELFVRVFDRATVGMLIMRWEAPPDLGSFRLVAQNAAARALASEGGSQLGRTLAESSPAVLETPVPARYAACLEEGKAPEWTMDWRARGQPVTYHCRCFAVGQRHVAVLVEDVSEKRRVQRELAKLVTELQRSNRELDDFAYVASHDLKSPLRDIHALSSWIIEDVGGTLPETSALHLTKLRDRADRMERLLDDLLQYSRAGRAPGDPSEVDLEAVVRDVEALLAPKAHRIVARVEGLRVHAPGAAVALVVRNLVANAIKHHDRPEGTIEILATRAAGGVVVSVRDDGPGIASAFHERVFRMFQTLKPRDVVDGSGMGLAIVKKVVESCAGWVRIASEARGTTIDTFWPDPEREEESS